DGVLHLRSDSDLSPSRPNLGDGVRSVSARNHREPEKVLRAGDPGEMANRVHARRPNALGICGTRGAGKSEVEDAHVGTTAAFGRSAGLSTAAFSRNSSVDPGSRS